MVLSLWVVGSEYHPGIQYFEQLTLLALCLLGPHSQQVILGRCRKQQQWLGLRAGNLHLVVSSRYDHHWSGASTKRSPTCSACLLIPSDSKHCQGEVTPRQQTACQSVGERVQVKGERCWCGRWEWSFGYLGPRWFYEPSWNGRTSHVTCNFGLKFWLPLVVKHPLNLSWTIGKLQ